MERKIEFVNNKGQVLRGIVFVPKRYTTAVVCLHGFPGSMSGTAQRVSRWLGRKGYLCLRFDFSGTDSSEGRFEDKLMSQEANEIRYAINYLERNFKYKRLVLFGHSTGAIDAALYAHRDKRISKLVLSGMVFDLKRSARYDFTDVQVRQFWERGFITYNRPGRWMHRKRLKKAFYDEFFKLNVPLAIKRWHKPLMIIHGTRDQMIPVDDPKELFSIANRPKKLVIIKGGKHNMKGPQHWTEYARAIERFIRW